MCISIDICDPKNNYNKITINSKTESKRLIKYETRKHQHQ